MRQALRSARGEVAVLNERHVVWTYNAHAHGMTEEDLNKALPKIERT